MNEFKADDPDDDQHNGDQADDMMRIAEKYDPCHDGAGSADPGPNGISSSNGDGLHGLRNREKAQNNKNNGDNARDKLAEPLAIFQSDGKADLKESGKQ